MSLVATETIFGRIVTGWDVEQAVLELVQRWASTYIAEVERQHGMDGGTLARPRSYVRTTSFDTWPEDQLPRVLVVSTGITAPPKREGDGTYRATWAVALGVVCSARTQDEGRMAAELIIGALRALLRQRPSLEGFASALTWATEDYDELVYDDSRSLTGGRVSFAVEVENVVSEGSGPTTPDDPLPIETDPWPLWPTVETVDTEVENENATASTRGEP